ncbi:MAG: YfcE family phosphodiesterase [Acholeplasma sp.]|nr:YfcE family phosphodiesterase [Acholeplasma sp.]
MKVLITSDAHGRYDLLSKIKQKHSDINEHLDAGDLVLTQKEFETLHIKAVRGNADRFLTLPLCLSLEIDNKHILVVHGHLYNVKYGMDELIEFALDRKADVVIYGHTHIQKTWSHKQIVFINPGAVSNPIPEYAIYENGKVTFIKGV